MWRSKTSSDSIMQFALKYGSDRKFFASIVVLLFTPLLGQVVSRETLKLNDTVIMEFVRIPPGEFMMGCSNGDTECYGNEKPAHLVKITKAFEIGKYEVTQAQWQSVMGTNPSEFIGADRPVEQVNWYEAQEFLQKLNGREDGYRYQLPTEAEWEYAARGGTTERYAGSLDDMAWYETNSGGRTHPVGQKQPNPWGLYDMRGNVWEWVRDWYDDEYYSSSPQSDPAGPASGDHREPRGGSYFSPGLETRVSLRGDVEPTDRDGDLGFRCAREPIR